MLASSIYSDNDTIPRQMSPRQTLHTAKRSPQSVYSVNYITITHRIASNELKRVEISKTVPSEARGCVTVI